MKKVLLFIVIWAGVLSLSFSQTNNQPVFGLSRNLTITPDGDIGADDILTEILDVYSLEPQALTPTLLKDYGRYSIRRMRTGTYEEFYNKKLVSLIDVYIDNVNQLRDPEGIIYEVRIMMADSNNTYIKGKLIELYGEIIRNNPPQQTAWAEYTPSRLFILDSLNAIVSSAAKSYLDVQASYLLQILLPYFKEALDKDPAMSNNEFIQAKTFYLLQYFHSSKQAQASVVSIIKDFIQIEAQQIAQ